MSEWWTYRPADFLMFAPDTYWRLFELHNAAWWPLGLLANVLTLALAFALWQRQARAARPGMALMAALSALCAWGFVWRLYVPINWGAQALAGLYALAALGWLLLNGASSEGVNGEASSARRSRAGTLLLLMAALSWPLLAPADGRPIVQAEFIGLAPDPTAVAGLGLLLHTRPATRAGRCLWWALLALGALACLTSAATLATLEQAQAFAPLAAAAIALGAALRRRA
jgi:hypothetical protein